MREKSEMEHCQSMEEGTSRDMKWDVRGEKVGCVLLQSREHDFEFGPKTNILTPLEETKLLITMNY